MNYCCGWVVDDCVFWTECQFEFILMDEKIRDLNRQIRGTFKLNILRGFFSKVSSDQQMKK